MARKPYVWEPVVRRELTILREIAEVSELYLHRLQWFRQSYSSERGRVLSGLERRLQQLHQELKESKP